MFDTNHQDQEMSFPFGHPAKPQPTSLHDVMHTLRNIRIMEAGLDEAEIRDRLRDKLLTSGIPARTEHVFAPGCRADIWIDGIVIEVKKKRPDRAKLLTQLHRYASQEGTRAIVLALERSVLVPDAIDRKPIHVISLNALWGVAL